MNENYKFLSFGVILAILTAFQISIIPTNNINHEYILKNELQSSNADSLLFNSTNAYNHIVTQLNFGYRVPGTIPHNSCANWIYSEMSAQSEQTVRHHFSIQKSGEPKYNCQNILGKINTDKENIIIFGTHWDSRAVAEKDTENRYLPIPGANDGASGVGVLIELAKILYSIRAQIDAQIWFLFIDAEDQGSSKGVYGLNKWNWCEGSWIFASDIENYYDSEKENFECFILLDMVGGTNLEFIKEYRNTDSLYNSIFTEGRSLGYNNEFPNTPKTMSIQDDHLAFLNLGMPVVDLIIDFVYGDWTYHHTHSDNLDNIDKRSLRVTGQTMESFVKTYYTRDQPNTWDGGDEPLPTSVYITLMVVAGLGIGIGVIKIIDSRKMKSFRKENQVEKKFESEESGNEDDKIND